VQERLNFISKVRNAEEKAIHLLEMESKPFQAIQASTLTAPAEPQTKP
jgi:hypothetical protein